MMSYEIGIRPRDVLFFRDARPMGGSYEGAGGTWPLSTTLHSALQSALYHAWPEPVPEWESTHTALTEKEKRLQRDKTSQMRFGGLKTKGPFPRKGPHLYVPTPADVQPTEILAPLEPCEGAASNLPLPYAVGGNGAPSKEKVQAWVSAAQLARYLKGDRPETTPADELYVTETRPGVGIDPATGAHREHVFFQAQYLRVRDDVTLAAFAECIARKANGDETDLLAKLFARDGSVPFIFGGQQGMAHMSIARNTTNTAVWRAETAPDGAAHIKWVLLAPAVFNAGWRPDWVDEAHRVRLKDAPERDRFATRHAWRAAIAEAAGIAASLVAARIPGSIPFSGWSRNTAPAADGDRELGPKRTLRAVPAGSVYYFKADTVEDGQALVRQLHGRVKSAWYGERGFGLGVCGTWSFNNGQIVKQQREDES